MRFAVCLSLLVLAASHEAAAQAVRCQLVVRQYGLGGKCLRDQAQPRPRPENQTMLASVWPDDTVSVFIATGPRDPPPWLGNFSMPGREFSFEIAREPMSRGASRVVLRNVFSWALVREWRATSDSAWLVFGPSDEPDPTEDDIAILERALLMLDSITVWDRQDDRDCTNDPPDHVSLYCLLYRAAEARMGRFHFRQPALQVVRAVVAQDWRGRWVNHQLMDFNNHSATTKADLRGVLEMALARARAKARSAR